MKIAQLMSDLEQFSGTEHYHKHWIGGMYTDGVEFLAQKTNCYWLIDAIFSYTRAEPFQIWELEVNHDRTALLTMKEDDGQEAKVKQEIKFTDFPEGKMKLYVSDGVLLLPSEY